MKTLLNSAHLIEEYLEGKLSGINRLLFATRLMSNKELRSDLEFQKKTYWMIKVYHRKKLKEELEDLHQKLMADPGKLEFKRQVWEIFGKIN